MKYTYWTFLAGWLAISGIIPLAVSGRKTKFSGARFDESSTARMAAVDCRDDRRDVHGVLYDASDGHDFWDVIEETTKQESHGAIMRRAA